VLRSPHADEIIPSSFDLVTRILRLALSHGGMSALVKSIEQGSSCTVERAPRR
jgi:hypothetical protein